MPEIDIKVQKMSRENCKESVMGLGRRTSEGHDFRFDQYENFSVNAIFMDVSEYIDYSPCRHDIAHLLVRTQLLLSTETDGKCRPVEAEWPGEEAGSCPKMPPIKILSDPLHILDHIA